MYQPWAENLLILFSLSSGASSVNTNTLPVLRLPTTAESLIELLASQITELASKQQLQLVGITDFSKKDCYPFIMELRKSVVYLYWLYSMELLSIETKPNKISKTVNRLINDCQVP